MQIQRLGLEDLNNEVDTLERLNKFCWHMFLLIDIVHNCGEDRGLYLSHLGSAILLANYFIESSKASSESGIEVIFDVVIGAK